MQERPSPTGGSEQAVFALLVGLILSGGLLTVASACGGSGSAANQEGPRSEASMGSGTLGVTGIDADRAWTLLEKITAIGPRPSGTAKNARLRTLITKELKGLGLELSEESFRERTPIGEIDFTNLYVDLPARGPSVPQSEVPLVILATHFDTKRLPFEFVGANDGGSGTAVLIELTRALAARQDRPVTYRILFLDGEEAVRREWKGDDNCYGSRHHVEGLRRSGLAESVAALVLLDMVGDADLQLTHELNSEPWLLSAFFDAADELGLSRHVGARAQELRDDHLSFIAAGIPSVDLIDFEYGPYNRRWHTAEDLLEHCSKESLEVIGRIVLKGLETIEQRVIQQENR